MLYNDVAIFILLVIYFVDSLILHFTLFKQTSSGKHNIYSVFSVHSHFHRESDSGYYQPQSKFLCIFGRETIQKLKFGERYGKCKFSREVFSAQHVGIKSSKTGTSGVFSRLSSFIFEVWSCWAGLGLAGKKTSCVCRLSSLPTFASLFSCVYIFSKELQLIHMSCVCQILTEDSKVEDCPVISYQYLT